MFRKVPWGQHKEAGVAVVQGARTSRVSRTCHYCLPVLVLKSVKDARLKRWWIFAPQSKRAAEARQSPHKGPKRLLHEAVSVKT